jgi:hypothetical protein
VRSKKKDSIQVLAVSTPCIERLKKKTWKQLSKRAGRDRLEPRMQCEEEEENGEDEGGEFHDQGDNVRNYYY